LIFGKKDHGLARENQIIRVLFITLVLNILVAAIKMGAGKAFNFLSLTSSGLESLFDGSANILALISISLASKPADRDHNFGHQKYETLGSFLIAALLVFSAIELGGDVFEILKDEKIRPKFGIIPIASILFSMGVSLFVTKYESKRGEELNSSLLLADSHHTFGDFIISFGVLFSMVATYFGYYLLDKLVAGLICIYLVFLALKIVKTNLPDLLDASPLINDQHIAEAAKVEGVYDIHSFRARGNRHTLYVDFHLHLDPELSLIEAHKIGKRVEQKMREALMDYCEVADILVHIEPYTEEHKKVETIIFEGN